MVPVSCNGFLAVTPPTNTKVEGEQNKGFARVKQKTQLTKLAIVFPPAWNSKYAGLTEGDDVWFIPDISFHDLKVYEQDGKTFVLADESLARLVGKAR